MFFVFGPYLFRSLVILNLILLLYLIAFSYPSKLISVATLISLLGYENAIKYSNKIKFNITSDLKRYGPKTKNINETLKYILVRNK